MKYKKTEKEIIQALVKYEGKSRTIADALTQSKVLERHGVVIVDTVPKSVSEIEG